MIMSRPLIHRVFSYAIIASLLLLAPACSTTPFSGRYQPGADTIFLWRGEPIPLEAQWRYLVEEKISVRGEIWDSILTPVDEVESLIFMREDRGVPEFLILSRVIKTSQIEIFRYLGGTKAILEGYPYREDSYALSSDTTDPEYRRYLDKIRAAGITPAPTYKVKVLDRLPVDTAMVRIMELSPGQGHRQLPAYGKLYPQERLELLQRRFF
jgi:hypothetical protein